MQCPRCQQPLAQVVTFGVEVDRCAQCDGTWLDRGECERASRPTGRFVKSVRRPDDAPAVLEVDVETRIRCPRCGKSCFRERYSSSSVEIDRCACGVWLDRGELDKILAHRQSKMDSVGMRLSNAERAELERKYARQYLDLEV